MAEISQIGFHDGEALLLIGKRYATHGEAISECSQNALDANAVNIWIYINNKTGTTTIQDDGNGTSRSGFEKCLMSVCHSNKASDKLGQFGLGLIAPLGKCSKFTFTSTPKSNPRGYLRWTFDTAEIVKQAKITGIPVEEMPNLHFMRVPQGKGAVRWRTEVKMYNVIKDRRLSRVTIASLKSLILERYSQKMLKLDTKITIEFTDENGKTEVEEFKASRFQGKALPIEEYYDPDAGKTVFRILIANKVNGKREGKVGLGEAHKEYARIPFDHFAKSADDLLDPAVVSALNSGVFAGDIISQNAKLNSDRNRFENNDALVGLCAAIETWFEKVGKKHIVQLKAEADDDKYQRLGKISMQVMESVLNLPEFAYLKEVVRSFKVGSVGTRHTPPGTKILGTQEIKSVAVHTPTGSSGTAPGGSGSASGPPTTERPGHMPLTVSGNKGTKRTMVKGNSLGLQFSYEMPEGSDKLWELDTRYGVLSFNTRHNLWEQCERDEKSLMRFQEHIAITALTLETVPPEWKERHRQMLDESMPLFVYLLMQGDVIAGRKQGSGLIKYREEQKKAKAAGRK